MRFRTVLLKRLPPHRAKRVTDYTTPGSIRWGSPAGRM